MPLFNGSYSGLYDRWYGQPYSPLGTNTNEVNATERLAVARVLRSKGGRAFARLMYALTGAGAGATATEAAASLAASAGIAGGVNDPLSQGGKRTVAATNLVNRVTTAADIALVQDTLTKAFGPTVNSGYPVDKSGNGGGGKVGGF